MKQFRGIIPAYAGSTLPVGGAGHPIEDHPRIRGEHLSEIDRTIDINRIIPAYAGSTPTRSPRRGSGKDHPRIRGEHHDGRRQVQRRRGSSPHTRGAPSVRWWRRRRRRIIPAYAGSTPPGFGPGGGLRDHPRIRGEHSDGAIHTAVKAGSSPHTRGARADPPGRPVARRIIPAYAGSTFSRILPALPKADHPRIRGEHVDSGPFQDVSLGSSPHTRGAPDAERGEALFQRIIPAYAGSTQP